MISPFFTKPETTAEQKEYYQRLDKENAAPLWEALSTLVLTEPQTSCLPALWRYQQMRPLLMESGRLITAKEAERRVLMLENPGVRGAARITQSLYAGLQLVLPGEITDTHRHVASALRFVIEGEGAYTAVDGERIRMRPGDLISTPSWTYHDHGNPGDTPVVWMDGLDIPIVNMFDTSFAEHHPEETQPVTRKGGAHRGRRAPPDVKGSSRRPALCATYSKGAHTDRGFTYPYQRNRETLDRLYRNGPLHPCYGVKMQYVHPATGASPMPTIGAFLQLLPSGFRGAASRSTDATVYCVAEGRGSSRVGDSTLEWREHDIFVAPSWYPVSHQPQGEAVLFSFSDRPAQQALGLWREDGA